MWWSQNADGWGIVYSFVQLTNKCSCCSWYLYLIYQSKLWKTIFNLATGVVINLLWINTVQKWKLNKIILLYFRTHLHKLSFPAVPPHKQITASGGGVKHNPIQFCRSVISLEKNSWRTKLQLPSNNIKHASVPLGTGGFRWTWLWQLKLEVEYGGRVWGGVAEAPLGTSTCSDSLGCQCSALCSQ